MTHSKVLSCELLAIAPRISGPHSMADGIGVSIGHASRLAVCRMSAASVTSRWQATRNRPRRPEVLGGMGLCPAPRNHVGL
jgi:hypothetical protein